METFANAHFQRGDAVFSAREIFSAPALSSSRSLGNFLLLCLMRGLFFCFGIVTVSTVVEPGTSVWTLSVAAFLGVVGGSYLAFTRLKTAALLLLLTLLYGMFRAAVFLLASLPLWQSNNLFLPYNFLLHGNLVLLLFSTGLLCSWFLWRWRHTLTVEVLLVASLTVYLLSGHRGFHFDTPQIVNSLAWSMGIGNLAALVLAGAASTAFLALYVYVATLPASPRMFGPSPVRTHAAQPRFVAGGVIVGLFALVIYGVSSGVHSHYHEQALSRTANGVGQEDEEGLSPLTFHSALGSTNQPAALVRLEGDYAENPFSPMLYLREAALSELHGNEIVRAPGHLDRDASFGKPTATFKGQEDPELTFRTPLVHSVYTLTKHEQPFAVDYPISIRPIKNPSPGRFHSTFQAYSMAPGFVLSELQGGAVGDPRWSEDERQHYLEQHADPRYAELAKKIAGAYTDPFEQAAALTTFLNKKSIYTLTPNHNVEAGTDPVSAYLFGDMRGYCVHFAHATVYMLRALGIPARIGTGYLTDLSEARDGHILLRMSDRHAWAEAYFAGRGWIPFDTQPEQVESHADSEVDMQLLEELMGMLEPGDEILPETIAEDEPGMEAPAEFPLPDRQDIIVVFALLLLTLLGMKAYLRYSWILPGSAASKLRRSYLAVASLLCDLGHPRLAGETREEYRHRISETWGLTTLQSNSLLLEHLYGNGNRSVDLSQVHKYRKQDIEALASLPWWRRSIAVLSPASLVQFLFARRW